ncbi:MAG: cysteine hydrolase family protein [Gammaproteobacteria bacterium]
MSTLLRRALIVIDVQNEYVTSANGQLPIEYPAIEHSLSNIGRAMDAAASAGIPIIVVQNTTPAGAPLFARGSHGWQLHEVVASRPYQHLVDKSLPSAFANTSLHGWLTEHGIDTLSVVGYMTHNCVAATVFDALHAGIAAEVLHDATGSVPYANRAGTVSAAEIHAAFTVVFQSRFAAVLSTDEWIAAVKDQLAPERDTIFGSNQRARLGAGG